jgi:hypothetical protein
MKLINSFIRIILAILVFPPLAILFFFFRLIYNINETLNSIITTILTFFQLNVGLFFMRLIFLILEMLAILIDIPIGLILSILSALSVSIEVSNSQLDIRNLGQIFKKAPVRRDR